MVKCEEMAVTGLRKASGPDAYLGENHSLVSRRCVNNERLTTRTSSIRKMWRDLESEGSVKENGKQQMNGVRTGLESPCSTSLESMESLETSTDANEIENECPRNQIEVQIGREDDKALCVQHSPFDVPEKDRVRKIFHEWGSKGFGGRTCMNNGSRAQRIGENECKRVRIVREWIESSTHQGDTCRGSSEEPASEIGSPIARNQDGTVDSGTGARSSIRRIFGRQALIDLLKKFQREREREVEGLLENHFVSNFAHRHRIQSLLKGRFLRNQRFVEVEKQGSVAASDLGLLRKTHAVADIRKGFLSKLNNNDHVAEGAQSDSDTSSANDLHIHTGEAEEVVREKPHEIGEQIETTNLNCDPKSLNPQGVSPVGERHDALFDSDSDASSDNDTRYDLIEEAVEIVEEIPNEIDEEFDTPNLARDLEAQNLHKFVSPQEREKPPLTVEVTETVSQDHDSLERNQSNHNIELSQGTSGTEHPENDALTEVDKVMLNQFQSNKPSVSLPLLRTSTESFNWQEASTQAEEWQDSVSEYEDDDDGWYQETIRSDFQESLEESYDNVEDTTESWFGGTSYLEAALAGRSNTLYSSDDGNGSRVELIELTSRRRVSNLLQSDFGTRLDLLMQSYVDRQDRVSESENGWMQSLDENAGGIEAVDGTEGAYPSTLVMTQTQGNNDLHGATDVRIPVIHQHLGTEGEIINGLRNDLNALHERMNDMQRMLEACMDVQLELQRSVQQEVYSALNRSINSGGACEDGIYDDHSGSSPAKGGVCFLCCDNGLESLPDRSVHMYICSKCAEEINWSKLKESARHSQV